MAGRRVSGVGKFSRRSDLPASPGLGGGDKGTTDLQYGDVAKLEAGARAAQAGRPAPNAERQPGGAPPVQGGLPGFILDQPTARPDEAATTGLSTGEGEGPSALAAQQPPADERELVLLFLSQAFDNKETYKMLQDMRDERARAAAPVLTAGLAAEPVPGSTPGYAGQQVQATPVEEAIAEPQTTVTPPTEMPNPSQPPTPAAEEAAGSAPAEAV